MTMDEQQAWVRPDERPFVHRVQDWLAQVDRTGMWYRTDFLTPREQWLAESTVRRGGLSVASYGGYRGAERQRLLIMPGDWGPESADFDCAVLSVHGRSGLRQDFAHGHILGSALGTGVDRRKLGDIDVTATVAHLVVCADIVPFLRTAWRQVGRDDVDVDVAPELVQWSEPAYERDLVSVQSVRADGVVAQACRWSRSHAQEAIHRGLVTLNAAELGDPDARLAEGDQLSIRGFGRIKVMSFDGETRSGRQRIEIGILRSRQAGVRHDPSK